MYMKGLYFLHGKTSYFSQLPRVLLHPLHCFNLICIDRLMNEHEDCPQFGVNFLDTIMHGPLFAHDFVGISESGAALQI